MIILNFLSNIFCKSLPYRVVNFIRSLYYQKHIRHFGPAVPVVGSKLWKPSAQTHDDVPCHPAYGAPSKRDTIVDLSDLDLERNELPIEWIGKSNNPGRGSFSNSYNYGQFNPKQTSSPYISDGVTLDDIEKAIAITKIVTSKANGRPSIQKISPNIIIGGGPITINGDRGPQNNVAVGGRNPTAGGADSWGGLGGIWDAVVSIAYSIFRKFF